MTANTNIPSAQTITSRLAEVAWRLAVRLLAMVGRLVPDAPLGIFAGSLASEIGTVRVRPNC